MMSVRDVILMVLVVTLTCLPLAASASETKGDEPPRIDIPPVLATLGSPDLVIVDVRKDSDWAKSDVKIKGAVREDPKNVESWAAKYPQDKTIVFYCT